MSQNRLAPLTYIYSIYSLKWCKQQVTNTRLYSNFLTKFEYKTTILFSIVLLIISVHVVQIKALYLKSKAGVLCSIQQPDVIITNSGSRTHAELTDCDYLPNLLTTRELGSIFQCQQAHYFMILLAHRESNEILHM